MIQRAFTNFNKFTPQFIEKVKNNRLFIEKVKLFNENLKRSKNKSRFTPLNLVKLYYFDENKNDIKPWDCFNYSNLIKINWKCIDCNREWCSNPNSFHGCVKCNKDQYNLKTHIAPNVLENMGTDIFLELLKKDGSFETNHNLWEGTKVDFLIKYKDSKEEDKYYGIQMKTCSELRDNSYIFADTQKYNRLILVCVCIKDKKIWLIPGDDVLNKSKISIGKKRSKYDKYFTENNNCINKLKYYINNLTLDYKTFEEYDKPTAPKQQIERDFYYLHKKYFKKYKLQRPKIEHITVDSFTIVNDVKIRFQNKVCGTIRNGALQTNFKKKAGHINKKVTYKPYNYKDFDCLFVHINIEKYKNYIYLIPIPELIKKMKAVEYKNIKGITGLTLNLYSKPNKIKKTRNYWDNINYLFNLENSKDIYKINIIIRKNSKI